MVHDNLLPEFEKIFQLGSALREAPNNLLDPYYDYLFVTDPQLLTIKTDFFDHFRWLLDSSVIAGLNLTGMDMCSLSRSLLYSMQRAVMREEQFIEHKDALDRMLSLYQATLIHKGEISSLKCTEVLKNLLLPLLQIQDKFL